MLSAIIIQEDKGIEGIHRQPVIGIALNIRPGLVAWPFILPISGEQGGFFLKLGSAGSLSKTLTALGRLVPFCNLRLCRAPVISAGRLIFRL